MRATYPALFLAGGLLGWLGRKRVTPKEEPPPPLPDMHDRMVGIEKSLEKLFEDRETHARRIVAQDARIAEQDRTIAQLQQQNTEQQQHANRLANSLEQRVKEIGSLEGRLQTAVHGNEKQGERLGQLEQQIPKWRDYVLKAKMTLRIWRQHMAAIRAIVEETGVALPPDPELPELPELEFEGA